ncbi:uncharacterized protein EI90DRAFT_3032120, partial [Cantharellus anzutake]|uniref:uncharacterized protein n=1 Tax=Cantharellus anzutake TaxID=1750568 RepID=UPI0019087520
MMVQTTIPQSPSSSHIPTIGNTGLARAVGVAGTPMVSQQTPFPFGCGTFACPGVLMEPQHPATSFGQGMVTYNPKTSTMLQQASASFGPELFTPNLLLQNPSTSFPVGFHEQTGSLIPPSQILVIPLHRVSPMLLVCVLGHLPPLPPIRTGPSITVNLGYEALLLFVVVILHSSFLNVLFIIILHMLIS